MTCEHGPRASDSDVEECWRTFWLPALEGDGVARSAYRDYTLPAIKRELYDYHGMLQQVPKVYDHVTGGLISKPNTMAFEVIGEADELLEKRVREGMAELAKDLEEGGGE